MNRLAINEERCKACKLCVDVCPKHLLALSDGLNSKGFHPIAIHKQEECTACAVCAQMCPDGCIEVFREVKAKA